MMAGVGGGQTQGGGQKGDTKHVIVKKESGLQGAHDKVTVSVSKARLQGNSMGQKQDSGVGVSPPGPTGGGRGKFTGMTSAMKGNARRGK
jgi:hypothetical protein